jgi:FixJ family two-component response regulator
MRSGRRRHLRASRQSGRRADEGFVATSLEEHRVSARRLVGTLDASELQILKCLIRGMSGTGMATWTGMAVDDVERSRAAVMRKLNAKRTADAVRIGLYAGVDLPN